MELNDVESSENLYTQKKMSLHLDEKKERDRYSYFKDERLIVFKEKSILRQFNNHIGFLIIWQNNNKPMNDFI